jgi:hypothetical protein
VRFNPTFFARRHSSVGGAASHQHLSAVSQEHCRVDKVQAALAAQDKRRADYKKTLPAKALSEGLLQYVKKNAWEK